MDINDSVIEIFLRDWEGNIIAPLNIYQTAGIEAGLSQNPSARISLSLDSEIGNAISNTAINSDNFAWMLDFRRILKDGTKKCIFAGPVLDYEYDSSVQSGIISLNAVGPWWRLSKRIVNDAEGWGKTEQGISVSFALQWTRSLIARYIIRSSEAIDGNHWIRALDTNLTGGDSILGIENWGGFRKISDSIEELSNSDFGFDWILDFENAFNPGELGNMMLADWKAGLNYGRDMQETIKLDKGGIYNNLDSVKNRLTLQNLTNKVNHPVANADGIPYFVESTAPTSVAKFGLFEDIQESELRDINLRKGLTDLAKDVLSKPQQITEASILRSDYNLDKIPIPFIDYHLGDRINVQEIKNGVKMIDGVTRIWDIKVEWDGDTKSEKATLGLYKN